MIFSVLFSQDRLRAFVSCLPMPQHGIMPFMRTVLSLAIVFSFASLIGCGSDASSTNTPPDASTHDAPSDSHSADAPPDVQTDGSLDSSMLDSGADATVPDVATDALSDSSGEDVVLDAADDADAPLDAPADSSSLMPMPDFSVGPYPSALDLLIRSIHTNATAYDSTKNYGQVAAQAYVIQAAARLLQASSGYALPGGEATRTALVDTAIGEAKELIQVSDKVVGGGPAYGLSKAWDAFSDGTTNPAYTAYSWQSGMVALGLAELYSYLHENPGKFPSHTSDIALLKVFIGQMLDLWNQHYTAHVENGNTVGFFWYSTQPSDAIAVHNTSALVAMASQIYAEAGGGDEYKVRPVQAARLLAARWSSTAKGGLTWHYCDDGYPVSKRHAEDVSHALITLQFIRMAHDHGWYDDTVSAKISKTLLSQMWSGNPARLHGYVDGSSGGTHEWSWTPAAVIGFASQANAKGGRPEVFDYARSLLVSSYMTSNGLPLQGASVDSARSLALAELIRRKPDTYDPDSAWSTVAGPGDDDIPKAPEQVRFYTVDWGAPANIKDAKGLSLTARQAQTGNANFLVDLTPGKQTAPVVVSMTYKASTSGTVQQWDGTTYTTVASLPASNNSAGQTVWMRTSFLVNQGLRFDYQKTVPGDNVLYQVTNKPAVARLEATPTGP